MPSRRPRSSLAIKVAETAFAAPQVVAHRVTRMALSGPQPSARDRKEFQRMVAEKNAAFAASWLAMAAEAARANQRLTASLFQSYWSAALGRKPSVVKSATLQRAALGVLDKGLAPVHRKAVANAKRLARTKLR